MPPMVVEHGQTQGHIRSRNGNMHDNNGVPLPLVVTHLCFGTPEPPTIPIMARGGTELDNRNNVEH